jgi:trk system potassium uptake protein TrkA
MARRSLYIIIVGCGRLGSYLANNLSGSGHSVVVIDKEETAFDSLSSAYSGFRITGDATEFDVLKQVKMDKADLVIATTQEDNLNLMIAQIAKNLFNVPKVMARVLDPNREKIYRDFDIETICPTTYAGDLFLESIIVSFKIKVEGSSS